MWQKIPSGKQVAIRLRESRLAFYRLLTSACSITLWALVDKPLARLFFAGGAGGTRTPAPLLAKEVLSQLGYGPVSGRWSLVAGLQGSLASCCSKRQARAGLTTRRM